MGVVVKITMGYIKKKICCVKLVWVVKYFLDKIF